MSLWIRILSFETTVHVCRSFLRGSNRISSRFICSLSCILVRTMRFSLRGSRGKERKVVLKIYCASPKCVLKIVLVKRKEKKVGLSVQNRSRWGGD